MNHEQEGLEAAIKAALKEENGRPKSLGEQIQEAREGMKEADGRIEQQKYAAVGSYLHVFLQTAQNLFTKRESLTASVALSEAESFTLALLEAMPDMEKTLIDKVKISPELLDFYKVAKANLDVLNIRAKQELEQSDERAVRIQ